MESKWEYKECFHQIADTGDYDGHYEISNGKDSISSKDDSHEATSILTTIAVLLNTFDDLKLSTEAETQSNDLYWEAKGKYDDLKAKYDAILATESGHESQTENVWQSGYAAGHEAGYERRIKDDTALRARCERMDRAIKKCIRTKSAVAICRPYKCRTSGRGRSPCSNGALPY